MFAFAQNKKLKKGLRRACRAFAGLAIGCQFLVPAGYMPGSFADGTPFVFCRMYAPAAENHATTAKPPSDDHAQSHNMHSMHAGMPDMAGHTNEISDNDSAHHDGHIGAEAWENCPLGALGAGAALAFSIQTPLLPPGTDSISTLSAAPPRSFSIQSAQARAPPNSLISLTS